MPIVSIFIGGVDFSEMKLELPRLFAEKYDDAGNLIKNTLNYGNFISAVINFLILALVVFLLVKGLNKLSELGKKKEEEAMRLFRYKVYEAQRKREQSELLKRRRKAAREKAVREKMPREKAMAEHGGMISVEGQVK